jgi:hypothetical protein
MCRRVQAGHQDIGQAIYSASFLLAECPKRLFGATSLGVINQ